MEENEDTQKEALAPQEPAEASLDELIAKKESAEEGSEDEAVIASGREERVETLSVKVVPQQPTEFVCKNCFLVKHRSQLADKKRMLCRDCV